MHACHFSSPRFSGQKAVAPRFRLLDRDGIASVGDYVMPGDVYVNMQRPTNTRDPVLGTHLPDSFYRPTPLSWKHAPAMAGEKCIIDKVMLTGVWGKGGGQRFLCVLRWEGAGKVVKVGGGGERG